MVREYRYPQYDLSQSIDVARRITDRGSGATLSMPEMAAFLGYKGTNNGAFITRMASARLFGLIDGPATANAATARAVAILHPDYPETADRARLDAFRAVPLFGAFLDAFRGRPLPDDAGMVNALVTRFKVPEKDARAVLGRLLASADQAGLFKLGGQSRMIEPTFASPSPSADAAATDDGASRPATQTIYPQSIPSPSASRFPKIIDGALDLMPSGPPWDEGEYQEWLSFFDQACRVYYRISRGGIS